MFSGVLIETTNTLQEKIFVQIMNMWIICRLKEMKPTNLWFFNNSPLLGIKSPTRSLRKVDFPTPLGPTIATREFKSIPKSTPLKRGFWPLYAKSTSNYKKLLLFNDLFNYLWKIRHSLWRPNIGGCNAGGSGKLNLTR